MCDCRFLHIDVDVQLFPSTASAAWRVGAALDNTDPVEWCAQEGSSAVLATRVIEEVYSLITSVKATGRVTPF